MNRNGWRGEAPWHLQHYEGPLAIVVDIGAFTGEFSIAAAERGAGKVVAFEPQPDNFRVLSANVEQFPTIEPWNRAVTADGSDIMLCSAGVVSSTIIVTPGLPLIQVPSVSFAGVLSSLAMIDYLKIDIEGGEFSLFDQESNEVKRLLVEGVKFLEVEIHAFSTFLGPRDAMGKYSRLGDAGARDELIRWLQELGFRDEPCEYRRQHPGAFCSGNHNGGGAAHEG